MQEITWTNCADAMPPDEGLFIICGVKFQYINMLTGRDIHNLLNFRAFKWTPYTPEKWKELNK